MLGWPECHFVLACPAARISLIMGVLPKHHYHMDIVCTRRFAAQVRLSRLAKWPGPNTISCWYGNVFTAPRQRFVVAMESTTLVTVLFLSKGLTNSDRMTDALRTTVAKYFDYRGWGGLLGKQISFDNGATRFWAASDRTMIG